MANDDNVRNWGVAGRAKPTAVTTDGVYVPMRTSRRGDQHVLSLGKPLVNLADEGGYFHASNPTPGTGIAGIAAADGYDAAEALWSLYNSATDAEGVRIYPDFIEIVNTVVDTNGTTIRVDVHMDNITRWSSGGSALTAVNTNMDSTESAKGVCRFGALVTTAASSSVRKLMGRPISSTDIVVGDVIRLEFGESKAGSFQGVTQEAEATAGRFWVLPCPPVVLGPGDNLLFTVNCASQSGAATWEINCGWYER